MKTKLRHVFKFAVLSAVIFFIGNYFYLNHDLDSIHETLRSVSSFLSGESSDKDQPPNTPSPMGNPLPAPKEPVFQDLIDVLQNQSDFSSTEKIERVSAYLYSIPSRVRLIYTQSSLTQSPPGTLFLDLKNSLDQIMGTESQRDQLTNRLETLRNDLQGRLSAFNASPATSEQIRLANQAVTTSIRQQIASVHELNMKIRTLGDAHTRHSNAVAELQQVFAASLDLLSPEERKELLQQVIQQSLVDDPALRIQVN